MSHLSTTLHDGSSMINRTSCLARLAICLLAGFFACEPVKAGFIDFTSTAGSFGSAIDGQAAGPTAFPVPGFAGVTLTIANIESGSAGTPIADAGGSQFGINSSGTGSGDDANTTFDSGLGEFITLRFNQAVAISSLRFATAGTGVFEAGDTFDFSGTTIGFSNLSAGGFVFSSPLSLTANQTFRFGATTGRIGFVGLDANVVGVTPVPDPSSLAFAAVGGLGILARYRRRRNANAAAK